MHIRAAAFADLGKLTGITQRCIAHHTSRGIDQWDESYPTYRQFREDIHDESLYIIEAEGRVTGCICINEVEYPGYENADWSGSLFFVIHKLIVDPPHEGRGLGRYAMRFAEELAEFAGKDSLRLDCFTENPRANDLYKKLGYEIRGEAVFRNRCFYLYEKLILPFE